MGFLIKIASFCCYVLFVFNLTAQNTTVVGEAIQEDLNGAAGVSHYLDLFTENLHRNAEASFGYLREAKLLSEKVKIDSLFFDVYAGYVSYYFIKQDYKLVTRYIDSALVYKASISPKKQLTILSRLAQSSFFLNEYEKAIAAYSSSIKLSEQHGLIVQKIGILNQLSSVYRQYGDMKNAEKTILKAIELNRNGSKKDLMYSKLLLGKIYAEQGKGVEAFEIYEEVHSFTKEHRDPVLLYSVNSYLGEFYKKNSDYKKAMMHINDNLQINTSINNNLGILGSKAEIADILVHQKKYDQAIDYINQYIPLAKKSSSLTYLEDSYEMLSEIYELKGDYGKALEYRKEFEIWNDSLISEEHLNAVSELEIKYETEKKENDILLLSEQKLKDEVALRKQKIKINRLTLGLIGGLLFFGAAFVIFRQHFRNKKQKELLIAITETQTREQKRIAQDLHDSVGGSLAITKNKLEQVFESNKDKASEIEPFLQSLSQTGEEIRRISHNMMPRELLKFGLVPAIQTLFDQLETDSFKTHLYHHGFEDKIDETKALNMFRIIQETAQNTLKHARAKSFTVNINKHDSYVSLLLEDDGKGFDFDVSPKKGIGLQNIENRIALLQGKMKIHSSLEKGTTFDIKIPLS